MNKIGKTLTLYPKTILFVIFLITSFLFYYAFLSEDKLRVDFSLEQMFPDYDPDKEKYDFFRRKFSREDDSVLLIYVPPTNPLSIESIAVVDTIVNKIKNIKGYSNCASIQNLPCSNLDYSEKFGGKFTDYNEESKKLYFQIDHL